ncbi:AraC family transcriptional regulator [Halioxenophilus aromaticivorans]|uniref:HTH araC/xylS-type domain-containing protein n=1 Tax=Halioxenophilus aromaticivorans TaxID=1306992 RepID=A0AAV3U4Z3_9ALTE
MADAAKVFVPARVFLQPGFSLSLPTPALTVWVQCLWAVQADQFSSVAKQEKFYPDGGVSLTIEFQSSGPVVWLALNTQTYQEAIGDQVDLLSVRFQPVGAFGLLGLPLSDLTSGRVYLGQDLMPPWYGRLHELLLRLYQLSPQERLAALQNWLLGRVTDMDRPMQRAVGMVSTACAGQRSVAELAAELGFTKRTLERYFSNYVGVTPAAFMRFARLKQARQLLQSNDGSIAEVAVACGFYDQAHFCHTFKSLILESPSAYRARKLSS